MSESPEESTVAVVMLRNICKGVFDTMDNALAAVREEHGGSQARVVRYHDAHWMVEMPYYGGWSPDTFYITLYPLQSLGGEIRR